VKLSQLVQAGKSPDELWAARQQRELAYARKVKLGTEWKTAHEGWFVVIPDAVHQGKVRIQRYDEDGFVGHTTFDNLAKLTDYLAQWEHTLKPAKGSLEKLSRTDRWQRSMDRLRARDKGQVTTASAKGLSAKQLVVVLQRKFPKLDVSCSPDGLNVWIMWPGPSAEVDLALVKQLARGWLVADIDSGKVLNVISLTPRWGKRFKPDGLLYHATPQSNVASIMRHGLRPRGWTHKRDPYPPRVYVATRLRPALDIGYALKNKGFPGLDTKQSKEPWVMLVIDPTKLKTKVKWWQDPMLRFSIWTDQPIPPSAITLKQREPVEAGLLARLRAAMPTPPPLVFHASPYARTILQQGFKTAKQVGYETLGGHGTYVSTTTLKDARKYARGLRLMIGVANGALSWPQFAKVVPRRAFQESLRNNMFGEYNGAGSPPAPPDVPLSDRGNWVDPHTPEALAWFTSVAFGQVDFNERPISKDQDNKRKWEVLKGLWAFSGQSVDVPLIVGGNRTQLKKLSMGQVGIVECQVGRLGPPPEREEQHHLSTYDIGPEGPQGKWTWNRSENEWRFYDPKDLTPVRIVK